MSQYLHCIPAFDGTNYEYWKAHMYFFLKSIDVWKIVETDWIKPEVATAELSVAQNSARLSNDKALHALCQTLSPSEFTRISNCESAKEAWQILETTYEGTKLVKSVKLQMLISRFEEIKMLENETFSEFYTRINDLRNSMVSFGKKISDAKLIKKILRSLPKHFRIKVIFIEESKDLDSMKIEELVESFQTYEYSLPPVKKVKGMAFKVAKSKVSSDKDSDNEEELAMIANMINKLMKTDKFIKGLRETPSKAELEEDPRG
jgi:mannitol/fructose-specific phosphotransferase system IIA component (Ntr-type)